MKIVHIGWYNPEPVGGVGKTILEQTKALHAIGHQVEIWHFSPHVETPRRMECTAKFPVWHLPMRKNRIARCLSFLKITRIWIDDNLSNVDVFHIHSVFIPENVLIASLGKAFVVTPNGGWGPVVLNGRNKWAKRLWILAKESRMWKAASAIQAVSREEAKQLTKLRGIAPIEYIPNGTNLPEHLSDIRDRDCYLFMGRLSIHQKGLDNLLEAIRLIKEKNATIPRIILAGPDYRAGKAFLDEFISLYQLSRLVEVRGPVQREEKETLFQRARVFIHTSRYEGMPLVLLEALAYGIPCLLTHGTNVAAEWAAAGCAFETSCNPEDIAESLIRLSEAPLEKESHMARCLAESEYSWTRIGKQLSDLYSSLTPSDLQPL